MGREVKQGGCIWMPHSYKIPDPRTLRPHT